MAINIWDLAEERMNNIAPNGNDGVAYGAVNKYNKEIKKGVLVDVYDVLNAFDVVNPATAHAIKKLLMPGKRGAKDAIQDLKEARNSINRAIELELEK